MIPYNDFQILPNEQKSNFITVFADYLISRASGTRKFFLYHMSDYFIEVCYVPEESRVEGIYAFKNTELLECYLDQIGLSDLHTLIR